MASCPSSSTPRSTRGCWRLPGASVTVSLVDRTLTLPDGTAVTFPIDPFARYCLLNGVDELGFLLAQSDAISAFESQRA